MRIALSADWHLSNYNDKIDVVSNLPDRLDKIKTTCYNMLSKVRSLGIQYVTILGDLLHGKSIIYAVAQSVLLDIFRDHRDLSFIIIDGNHDLSGKAKTVVSALKSLDHEPNVTRISEPLKIGEILFVPYSFGMVDYIKNNSAKYLFSHFGLNEGKLNSGISIVSDLALKDLTGRYKTVVLGHYHQSQEIITPDIRLYYTGSIVELDWGERKDNKRFLTLDTKTDEIQSVPTEGYRKHLILEINKENKEFAYQEGKKLKTQGHYVKFETTDDVNVKDIEGEFPVIHKFSDYDITNRGITSSMSTKERLEKYLQIKNIPESKISKYLDIGLDIVNSCTELES